MTTRTARLALVALTGAAIVCTGATAAHAAGTAPAPLSAADLSAATAAASSGQGMDLATRAAQLQAGRAGDQASVRSLRAGGTARTVVPGTTAVVNVLSRDFVADGSGPVAHLGYVSNTAKVGDQTVSVWSVKAPGGAGWKAVNAAAGDLEAGLARKAAGASIVREPQVNAFYAVKGDRVLPLNDAAAKAVGSGMSLRDYQRLVHRRYAAMLPGSAYDKAGMAGGFGQPAKAPAAASSTTATSSSGSQTGMLAAGGVGLAAVAGAGAVVARRRRAQG